MTNEFATELIESYLRNRQVRYFRGRHDQEYFFLVNTYHGRLHVHLEVCGARGDSIKISVATQQFHPAQQRERITELARRWNRTDQSARAIVYESSDPRLLGVGAENHYSHTEAGDFATVADQTIQSAIELFGRIRVSAGLMGARDEQLLDAG